MTAPRQSWSDPQRLAIESRGRNVIVSAGAGSGKTSVLVERVVRCVLDDIGLDLTKLLVVTFTEAAAAEMRKRVADRLEGLLQAAQASDDNRLTRRLSDLRGQLEQAQISTLHGFCMHVVRQNYLHLDIEPGFSILGEEDGLLLKQDCLDQVIESQLSGLNAAAFRQMMDALGIADPLRLRRLVFRLDTFSRSQQSPHDWLESMRWHYDSAASLSFDELPWTDTFANWCTRQLQGAMKEFQSAYTLASTVPELAAYADNLDSSVLLAGEALHALQSRQWDYAAAALQRLMTLKSPRASTDDPVKARVQQLRKQALDEVSAVSVILARGVAALQADVVAMAPTVSTLVDVVLDFQTSFMSAKRERGVLDFNDLEHCAFAVLTDERTGEAQRLQAQFAEIFVDEFQDTSPIQDALVATVARPHGNVFVVGDVKQSIYRFRMAQPQLFLDKYHGKSLGAPFQTIDLLENYRSRHAVVSVVNHIFSQIFSEEFGGARYDDDSRMQQAAHYPEPGRDESGLVLSDPVEVHLLERDVELAVPTATGATQDVTGSESGLEWENAVQSPSADILSSGNNEFGAADNRSSQEETASHEDVLAITREARVIAERIGELMGMTGAPPKQVWDARQQTYRALQYRDIVVLLRSVKGRVSPILEVFQTYNIPGYGVTSTGFYSALEIQWLLAALAAIDNPRREIEFVATMRSPLGGFTDEDLAELRIAHSGNFYDAVRAVAQPNPDAGVTVELHDRVRHFLLRLNGWRRFARRTRAADVLQRLLDDSGLFEYLQAMVGGRIRTANVQTLLERARAFDKVSVDGVYGFVNHARELLQNEVDLGEARTLAEAEDVVRVMTIHQSKGLEFPVVFIADLGKRFYRDPLERSLPLHRTMGFGPQRVDSATDRRWKTVPSIALDEAETVEFLAEEARILYVATTRAREQLILVGSARGLWKRLEAAGRTAEFTEEVYAARLLQQANSSLDWLLAVLWRHPNGKAALGHYLADYVDLLPETALVPTAGASYRIELYDGQALNRSAQPLQSWDAAPDQVPANDDSADASNLRHALNHPDLDLETLMNWLETAERQQFSDAQPSTAPGDRQIEVVDAVPNAGPPAKLSATDLRRLWAGHHLTAATGMQFATRATAERLLDEPEWVAARKPSGRERGTAFHRVMQTIDFAVTPAEPEVVAEIWRALEADPNREQTLRACEPNDVVRFLNSPLGIAVRTADRVMREQPFFHRIEVPDVGEDGFVTVQGVMDLLVELSDKWLLIDYKTDSISAEAAPEAATEYAAQISVYLDVAESVLGSAKPIEAWLYFVQPGVAVPLSPVHYEDLF